MIVESIHLYKTAVDNTYKNIYDSVNFKNGLKNILEDLDREETIDKYYVSSFSPKSISINKEIRISIIYDGDMDIRYYNYCKIISPSISKYYFINSINYNDTLNQYILELEYDVITNTNFSFENRELTLSQGHLSPLTTYEQDEFKLCTKSKYNIFNNEKTRAYYDSLIPTTNFLVWLKIAYNDYEDFTYSTVTTSSPLKYMYIPFCQISNYELSSNKFYYYDYQFVDSLTGNTVVEKREGIFPLYQSDFHLPANLETSVNSMSLTVFPTNALGVIFSNNSFYFNDKNKLQYFLTSYSSPFVAYVFPNSNYAEPSTYFYTLPTFQYYEIPYLEREEFLYNEKRENLPVSNNFYTSYSLKIGSFIYKLPFVEGLISWKVNIYQNNRSQPTIEVFADGNKVLPKTVVENNFEIPFTVDSKNQWFRENRNTFNLNSLFGILTSLTQMTSLNPTDVLNLPYSIASPIAKVKDLDNKKDFISKTPFSAGDIIDILDIPTILIESIDLGELTESAEKNIYDYGIEVPNLRMKYKKAMSAFNYIKGKDCYLSDIGDVEVRKKIEEILNNGVTVWSYHDYIAVNPKTDTLYCNKQIPNFLIERI